MQSISRLSPGEILAREMFAEGINWGGTGTILDWLQTNYSGTSKLFLFPNLIESDDDILNTVKTAVAAVVAAKKADPADSVHLFGMSRGATHALIIAHVLKQKGIKVDYLGLIDPNYGGMEGRNRWALIFQNHENYRTERELANIFREFATIPDNVKAGDIFFTPGLPAAGRGTIRDRLGAAESDVSRVRLLWSGEMANPDVKYHVLYNVGHTLAGRNAELGAVLRDSAAAAGVTWKDKPMWPQDWAGVKASWKMETLPTTRYVVPIEKE